MISHFSRNGKMLAEAWPTQRPEVHCARCNEHESLRLIGTHFFCERHR